jgi:hypothetical protein
MESVSRASTAAGTGVHSEENSKETLAVTPVQIAVDTETNT